MTKTCGGGSGPATTRYQSCCDSSMHARCCSCRLQQQGISTQGDPLAVVGLASVCLASQGVHVARASCLCFMEPASVGYHAGIERWLPPACADIVGPPYLGNSQPCIYLLPLQSTTRVKPFICTMPMRLDEGWNQIQFNLADFTRRAYGEHCTYALHLGAGWHGPCGWGVTMSGPAVPCHCNVDWLFFKCWYSTIYTVHHQSGRCATRNTH